MNYIDVVYNVRPDGKHETAVVPVNYRQGVWPMKDLIQPAQLARLARYANRIDGRKR